jgi:hypothetical protein
MPASDNVFRGDTVLATLSLPHGTENWHRGHSLHTSIFFTLTYSWVRQSNIKSSHPHWFILSLAFIIVGCHQMICPRKITSAFVSILNYFF